MRDGKAWEEVVSSFFFSWGGTKTWREPIGGMWDLGRARRTLSAMVLRTSSVLILESATALVETARLTANCECGDAMGGRWAIGQRGRMEISSDGGSVARGKRCFGRGVITRSWRASGCPERDCIARNHHREGPGETFPSSSARSHPRGARYGPFAERVPRRESSKYRGNK